MMTTDAKTKTPTQKSGRYHLINYIAKEGISLHLGNQEKAAKALEITAGAGVGIGTKKTL